MEGIGLALLIRPVNRAFMLLAIMERRLSLRNGVAHTWRNDVSAKRTDTKPRQERVSLVVGFTASRPPARELDAGRGGLPLRLIARHHMRRSAASTSLALILILTIC